METIKYTIGLVFQLVFGVAAIGTYFNMLQLPRLESESKSFAQLVHFIISMGLRAWTGMIESFDSKGSRGHFSVNPLMTKFFTVCCIEKILGLSVTGHSFGPLEEIG